MKLYALAICALSIAAASVTLSNVEAEATRNLQQVDVPELFKPFDGGNAITCHAVTSADGDVSFDGGATYTETISYYCDMIGDGSHPLGLELVNLWPTFEIEWNKALSERSGRAPGLRISVGSVVDDRIILPSDPSSYDYDWHVPSSSSRLSSRNLGTNQFGIKTVLVYRVTIKESSGNLLVPTASAAAVSAKVFGTGGNTDANFRKQFLNCSNNQLTFNPAGNETSATSANVFAATGVIDVTVDSRNNNDVIKAMKDATAAAIKDLGVVYQNYDYRMFHVPQGTRYNGSTNWFAVANRPGYNSWYNNDNILDLETLMHEVGHNLGLMHSSDGNNEYGDNTGYMGSSHSSDNDEKKCFNSAKSFYLGWYGSSPDRVESINYDEVFDGKLIGVADYANSNADHTLLLEIIPPSGSTWRPMYLTYNRAKGMNADTHEAADMVTITDGRPYEFSYLIKKMGTTDVHIFPEYSEGRDLIITTSGQGQDPGQIDYISATVRLETTTVQLTPNPTPQPTPNPTPQPTPNPGPTSLPGGGGDPHFQTFNGLYFSYHGHCDLVLVKNPEFSSGFGLLLHIRTTRVDTAKFKYSYISGIALKIGRNVLEIFDDGSLVIDGIFVGSGFETTHFSGYALNHRFQGTKKHIIVHTLNLANSEDYIQVRANTRTRMLYVDVSGAFLDSEGLLGTAEKSGLMGRNGVTDLNGHWNAHGEEWQVLDTEPKLFQENRAPQHPNGCIYEDVEKKSNIRRRLMETSGDHDTILDLATNACAKAALGPKKNFCIEDIMATGSLEVAEDPFYY